MDATKTIQSTKNYSLFSYSEHNRAVNVSRRRALRDSMQKHGWIKAYPMVCEIVNGKLVIKDGQHRFTIAQELGISVHYIITTDKSDVAEINAAQKSWVMSDYAERFARLGNPAYEFLMEYSKTHNIPVLTCAALLNEQSTCSVTNFREAFVSGNFKIKNTGYATMCVRCFTAIREENKECATASMMQAIAACCHVSSFDVERMIKAIHTRGDLLKRVNNRPYCLEILEKIYNNGLMAKNQIPLKFEAEKAVKDRNAVGLKKGNK